MNNLTFTRIKIFLSFLCICVFSHTLSAETPSEKFFYYNEIPGCDCFLHCRCYSYKCYETEYTCDESQLQDPQDVVWHTFMKAMIEARRVGPYLGGDLYALAASVGYNRKYDCSMLAEYLNGINMLKSRFEKEANDSMEWYRQRYVKAMSFQFTTEAYKIREAEILAREIDRIKKELANAKTILDRLPAEIIPLYGNILSSCPHKSASNLALSYNEGLFCLMHADFEGSLEKVNELVLFAETGKFKDKLLNSKIYQQQGESLLEVGLYHEAIAALTKSIEKDPKNKDAYFSRAAANFEVGNFDTATQDFRSSQIGADSLKVEPRTSSDFSTALLSSIGEGAVEATVDFVPSLCNTACGLGNCLWCFAKTPIDSSANFCNACSEVGESVVEYISNLDQETINGLAGEVRELYQKFDSLSESEKGSKIGYCIGKYGVDIFAGGATLKCISAMQKLKKANRLANLEALASTESSKEAVKAAAMVHAAERETFFKSVKIHWDKQNKHVPGKHNYEQGRSVFDHKNAQELLDKFAGKGTPVNNKALGTSGYRERIDFGECIGYYIPENDPSVKLRTTRGIIHYSSEGAHIVPANPVGS